MAAAAEGSTDASGACTLTVRMPYGDWADGTMSTLGGLREIEVGEEAVLMLNSDASGNMAVIPFNHLNRSIYRVYRGSGGATGVVSGDGEPLLKASFGPVFGSPHEDLRRLYYFDEYYSESSALAALGGIQSGSPWNGFSAAKGPWGGIVRIDLGGDVQTICDAYLSGTSNGTSISLTGACTADYAGTVDLSLAATRSGATWSGSVDATPRALPAETRSATWTSLSAAGDVVYADFTGTHAESGYSFTYNGELRLEYTGNRPLMTFSQFANFVVAASNTDTTSEGTVQSMPLTSSTCKQIINVVSP